MDTISHLAEQTLTETVAQPGLTVIDFWAVWSVLRDGELRAAQAGVIGAERLVEALDRLAGTPAKAAA